MTHTPTSQQDELETADRVLATYLSELQQTRQEEERQ